MIPRMSRVWKRVFLAQVGLFVMVFVFPSQGLCKKEHLVYFPNTAYELNIYKIYGKKPGKTLMLIGGIQGNEPGGFLSADLYADMSLEKGNLIVVPRANFYSIITNHRGPHGDMNRKFTHEEGSSSMEDKIVTILKKLISESDYLLNLHDGAGYYHPTYIDKWRNPMCFGQAVIADCETYRIPGNNKTIELGKMTKRVLAQVNPHINSDLHRFHFMNTRTGEEDSPHKEQRKSATYYALTKHHIPAFGVETSKFLPSIDLKVRFHNLVINAFMKLFGIVPESPGLFLDPPVLKYLVVSINGQTPIVINDNQTLEVAAGDSVNVTHIESNYERGLSLDILGHGELNDYRKDFRIYNDTSLIVRRDNDKFAEIPIKITSAKAGEARVEQRQGDKVEFFVIEARDHRILVASGETLRLVRGEKIVIVDVIPRVSEKAGVKVNFKGFVGNWKNNTGEDRGFPIDTLTDLMERHSLDKRGESYEIVATRGDTILGKMLVALVQPKMDYLVLKVNSHKHLFLRPGDSASLTSKDEIRIEDIQTNLSAKGDLCLNINGHKLRPGEERRLRDISQGTFKGSVQVERGSLVLGKIFLQVN